MPAGSRVDAQPRREPAGAYDGTMTVEATSIVFERDGTPSLGIVTGLTPDGRRALANTRDADVMVSMTVEAWEGAIRRYLIHEVLNGVLIDRGNPGAINAAGDSAWRTRFSSVA